MKDIFEKLPYGRTNKVAASLGGLLVTSGVLFGVFGYYEVITTHDIAIEETGAEDLGLGGAGLILEGGVVIAVARKRGENIERTTKMNEEVESVMKVGDEEFDIQFKVLDMEESGPLGSPTGIQRELP
jgi:hypothetical protein